MTIAEIRAWDDLTPDERVQLENSIEEALVAQAKVDLSNENIDVRMARPTADITGGVFTANTWIMTAASISGPGTYDNVFTWVLNDRQNAALWGFFDNGDQTGVAVNQKAMRMRIRNATTILAILETAFIREEEHVGGYFRQVFLWKKNETMAVDVMYADGAVDCEVVFLIKVAEPAGQTVGCKV